MERYIAHLIKGAEYRTRQFMGGQVKDPASMQFGGIRGDIWEAKPTIYALAPALAVYFNENSCFYKNGELYDAVNLALDFVARTQREDGSFDYPSCNFKSAADTSFCFKRLIAAYRLLVKCGMDTDEKITALKENKKALAQQFLNENIEGNEYAKQQMEGKEESSLIDRKSTRLNSSH